LGGQALRLFQNESQIRIITGTVSIRIINPEGALAASLSTRIALGTTIDTHSPTAGWRFDQIQLTAGVVVDLHGRDTKPTSFFDAAQFGSIAREEGLLIATAFAAAVGTTQGTFDGDDFFVGVELK